MYGRSDGGVINQVGKRGTNEWHFGAQVLWEPKFARANEKYVYYANGLPTSRLRAISTTPRARTELTPPPSAPTPADH